MLPARVSNRSARDPNAKLVSEGIEGRVASKGPLSKLVYQLVRTMAELREKARFLRVSPAGLRESHVHDVIITKEAPNYRVE